MAEKLLFARSVTEAFQIKDEDAVFLAGGTEINRLGSSIGAKTLVHICKIPELKQIGKADGLVSIGAAVTFQEAIDAPEVPEYFKDACRLMASRTKRNMATVGGNTALCRDDSYLLPTLIAAGASVCLALPDGSEEKRDICAFIDGPKEALITAIVIPADRVVVNKRIANTAMSHSALNISLGADPDGRNISIGAAVKNSGVYRLQCLAEKLEADPAVPEAEILETVKNCGTLSVPSDMYGSEDYKRYLIGAIVYRLAADVRKEA